MIMSRWSPRRLEMITMSGNDQVVARSIIWLYRSFHSACYTSDKFCRFDSLENSRIGSQARFGLTWELSIGTLESAIMRSRRASRRLCTASPGLMFPPRVQRWRHRLSKFGKLTGYIIVISTLLMVLCHHISIGWPPVITISCFLWVPALFGKGIFHRDQKAALLLHILNYCLPFDILFHFSCRSEILVNIGVGRILQWYFQYLGASHRNEGDGFHSRFETRPNWLKFWIQV